MNSWMSISHQYHSSLTQSRLLPPQRGPSGVYYLNSYTYGFQPLCMYKHSVAVPELSHEISDWGEMVITTLLRPACYLTVGPVQHASRALHSPLLLPRAEPSFNLVSAIGVPSCTLGPPPRVRCSQAASLTQEPLSTLACTVI